MKLADLVERLTELDDELVIFIEDSENADSEIILEMPDESYSGDKEQNERVYHYLIEVAIAKEFIQDWVDGLDHKPTAIETANRLYEYAKYDA